MATIFWGHKGALLVHVLDFGDTITAEHYCDTLEVLWQAFSYKKPGCCANCMITPCLKFPSGLVTRLWCYAWEVMDHACHSPDCILSGFHLCGHCKKHASVKRFSTNAKVRQTVTSLTLIFIMLCSTVGQMLKWLWWLLHGRYYMYHLLSMYHGKEDKAVILEHLLP
jgi:hypothetical protein